MPRSASIRSILRAGVTRARTSGLRWALLLSVLAAGACGGAVRNPFRDAMGRQILVEVNNRNSSYATVFAVYPGGQRRLGAIVARTENQFLMTWQREERLRLRVNLLAGRSFTTNEVIVRPGDVLRLLIDPVLARTVLRR